MFGDLLHTQAAQEKRKLQPVPNKWAVKVDEMFVSAMSLPSIMTGQWRKTDKAAKVMLLVLQGEFRKVVNLEKES